MKFFVHKSFSFYRSSYCESAVLSDWGWRILLVIGLIWRWNVDWKLLVGNAWLWQCTKWKDLHAPKQSTKTSDKWPGFVFVLLVVAVAGTSFQDWHKFPRRAQVSKTGTVQEGRGQTHLLEMSHWGTHDRWIAVCSDLDRTPVSNVSYWRACESRRPTRQVTDK